MGQANGKPGEGNIFATGQTTYINEKGETVTDTFHHYNGETVRQTENGQLPTSGGGFISQTLYAPWVTVVVVASIFLLVSTVILAFIVTSSKQKLRRNNKSRWNPKVEEKIPSSIPLYSLNKPRSHHGPASGASAKWNIDLLELEEVDLEA